MKIIFKTQYEPNIDVGIEIQGESKTLQEFKNDCDINVIMEKIKCGIDPTPASVMRGSLKRQPIYGDFTMFGDFSAMQNKILQAEEMFASLPAQIRAKFGDNPASLIEFVNNPENREECEKLGLFVPKKQESEIIKPVAGSAQVDTEIEKGKETPSL